MLRACTGTRPRRLTLLAACLTVALAACGSSTPSESGTGTAPSSAAATSGTTGEPATSQPPGQTSAPGQSTEPAGPSRPPASGGAVEPSPAASERPPTGTAAACSGSAENRDFFAAAGEAFGWEVYCAVLPDGWYVATGSYRLAGGGRLEITYRGPDGGRFGLREGSYCAGGASACAPRHEDLGPTAFGDRSGELVTLGQTASDGFAVYVDPGQTPSWEATGQGLDEAAFRSLVAELHPVR